MHQVSSERSERSVDRTVRFSCEKENGEFNVHGDFQSTLSTTTLCDSTEYLLRAGEAWKRKFLIGIILRCQDVKILEDIDRILQITHAKAFTYARSRFKGYVQEDMNSWDSGGTHPNVLRIKMRNTWEWFSNSPSWTKSHYLIKILSKCSVELLRMLGNLAHVLVVRQKRNFLQFNTADNASGSQRRKISSADSVSSDDPALMVVPGGSKSLSGVSLYRDFIRGLPVHISKRILGLLDMASLQSCAQVSLYWKYLTEDTLTELKVLKKKKDDFMVLQGNYFSGANPAYAKICEVLVPVSEDEDIQPTEHCSKHKEDIRGFESVYKGVKTKVVEMEERNVYCNAFNSLILLNREDPRRVAHYDGGSMAVLGSRDCMVHLQDISLLKEAPRLKPGHVGSVRAVLICEERSLVISGSYDLAIRCWNINTGVCTMYLSGHTGAINCLDLHENILVSGARDCKVKVWCLLRGKCLKNLRFSHHKPVQCVKIHTHLVLSGCEGGQIKMWDIQTAALLKVIDGHQGCVKCLFFDQWHILSGGSDGQVLGWSTNRDFKKCLMTFYHPREVAALSLVFLRVITGCADGKIRIFNFLSGDCLRIIKIGTIDTAVFSLHTHPNSILVNSNNRVLLLKFAQQVWDYETKPKMSSSSAIVCAPPSLHQLPHPGSACGGLASPLATPSQKFSIQKGIGLRLAPPNHTRSCSAPSMHQQVCAVQRVPSAVQRFRSTVRRMSARRAVWRERHPLPCCSACTDLQVERSRKSPSGRPRSARSLDAHSRINELLRSPASTRENPCMTAKLIQSERAVLQRVRKRGPHHPVTFNQMLLRIGTLPQHRCELAYTNMLLNARLRDDWGPLPPDPDREQQTVGSPTPPCKAPRRSHVDPGPSQPIEGMVKIYTPLRNRTVGFDRRNTLHSRQIGSSIPSQKLIHPQPPQHKYNQRACSVRRVGAFTTTAEVDVQPLQPMFMRRALKRSENRVDSEASGVKPTKAYNPLDRFRDCGGFRLMTDTEEQEFIQAQLQPVPHPPSAPPAKVKERQCRTARNLNILGRSARDGTREYQVYAPELGKDTYI